MRRMTAEQTLVSIGAAHIDRRGMLRGPLVLGTSNPGEVHLDFGGVARNVAGNLARLGCFVSMLSRVGADDEGRSVIAHLEAAGIDTSLVSRSPCRPTASYTAILENTGELVLGLADMDIYDEIDAALLQDALPVLRRHKHWFVDCNLPGVSLDWLLSAAGATSVYVDAVSVVKSRRLRPLLPRISVLFANIAQAGSIAGRDDLQSAAQAAAALREMGARAGVLTAGAREAAVWCGDDIRPLPVLAAAPRDVTGAGDAMIAGTIFGLMRGDPLQRATRLGLAAAAITVESPAATAPELSPAMLERRAGL